MEAVGAKPQLPELEIIDANHQNLAGICQSFGVLAFSGYPLALKSLEKMLTDGGIKVFQTWAPYQSQRNSNDYLGNQLSPSPRQFTLLCNNCTLIPMAIPMAVISRLLHLNPCQA